MLWPHERIDLPTKRQLLPVHQASVDDAVRSIGFFGFQETRSSVFHMRNIVYIVIVCKYGQHYGLRGVPMTVERLNEQMAKEIYDKIKNRYYPSFAAFVEKMGAAQK